MAICHEQLGRVLLAWRELHDALDLAQRDHRADREPIIAEHLATVEARLSWISLTAPANVGDAAVTWRVDGTAVAADGTAIPLEAGEHEFAVSAKGFRTGSIRAGVAPSEHRTIQIEHLDAIAVAVTKPNPPPVSAIPVITASAGTPLGRPARARWSTLRTIGLVTGVAGVLVSLAAGAYALDRKSVVRTDCDPVTKTCTGDGLAAASAGYTATVVGTATFVVGLIGFGTWTFLPGGILDRADHSRPPGPTISLAHTF
jgi:hypothetical protein